MKDIHNSPVMKHVSNYLYSIVEFYILLIQSKPFSAPQKNWEIKAKANNITTATRTITPMIPKTPGEIVSMAGAKTISRMITIIKPKKPSINSLMSGILL
jgi:hypothetical protein